MKIYILKVVCEIYYGAYDDVAAFKTIEAAENYATLKGLKEYIIDEIELIN